jgi:hypothetical protein
LACDVRYPHSMVALAVSRYRACSSASHDALRADVAVLAIVVTELAC